MKHTTYPGELIVNDESGNLLYIADIITLIPSDESIRLEFRSAGGDKSMGELNIPTSATVQGKGTILYIDNNDRRYVTLTQIQRVASEANTEISGIWIESDTDGEYPFEISLFE